MLVFMCTDLEENMKYLYYTLYLFYSKTKTDWPPIISITGVMSFLISALIFSFYDTYRHFMGDRYPLFSVFMWIVLCLVLYKILYDYYKPREAKLLKEMDKKPLWAKVIIVLLSTSFIVLVVKLWMFDGTEELYQFIKSYL